MKYKIGMSDRRTRAGSTKRTKSKNIRMSAKDFGSSSRRAPKREGFRKFSKFSGNVRGISRGGNGGSGKGRLATVMASSNGKKFKKLAGRALAAFVTFGFISGVLAAIGLGLYLKSLESSLPDPDKLIERTSDQSTILYDRNGKELFKIYGDQNRQFVKIDDIPEHTKWALLAAEDVEFYQHKGLDWKGITHCGILSLQSYLSNGARGGLCGASTITQQLVRNTLMYDVFGMEAFERDNFLKSVRRKLRELLLSMQVEQTLTKDEILQLYMNEVPLGGVNYGYEAASQSYFGKSVKELDLAESALLAGIIQTPSITSPLYGLQPELSEVRQDYVLDQMAKHRSLTGVSEEEIEAARTQELEYSSGNIDIEAYHFVFYMKQILEKEFGPEVVERGGLKVTTTLDLSTQRIAEEEVVKGIQELGHPRGVYNAGMVVVDPNTNQILAMVGSVDPNKTDDPRIDGNVNITTSLRQMGSSFKPYVYLTAFEKYGPWLATPDIPMEFGNYKPENWDDRYYGLMTAREALIQSRNIPANYTMQLVGIDPVIQTAEKVGVTTLTDRGNYGLSLALGAAEMRLLEHAQGFSVFATGGIKRDVTGILKVENSAGEVLKEYKETKGERVFDEKDVYMLNWVLCDLGGFGDQPFTQNYNLNGRRAACGKTGTTNGPKDLVAIQYHKNIVVAMWAGNNNGEEVPGAWSTTVPLPIVHSFMERIAGKYPSELPTRPSGVLAATVCEETGRLADSDSKCKKVPTVYVEGRAPKKDEGEEILVCKKNSKIPSNLEEAKTYVDSNGKYELLESKWLLNYKMENAAQQSSYEKFIKSKTDFLVTKPDESLCDIPLGPGNSPVVDIVSPTSGTSVKPGDQITVRSNAHAQGDVERVEYRFNGVVVGSSQDHPYEVKFTVPGNVSGNTALTATVYDDKDRTGTDHITINVDNPQGSEKVIKFETPQSGAHLPFPVDNQEIRVSVTGFQPLTMQFLITYPNGSDTDLLIAHNIGNGVWRAYWTPKSQVQGDYTIGASGGGVSSTIGVKVGN